MIERCPEDREDLLSSGESCTAKDSEKTYRRRRRTHCEQTPEESPSLLTVGESILRLTVAIWFAVELESERRLNSCREKRHPSGVLDRVLSDDQRL
jgi:uncharacterized protein (DUF2384 family)